ncbi:TPA: hypothetical protein DDZ10_04230 [Candidatus Uhrbacteria bacterium]|nr:MAG: hypothetical protein UY79_C0012G0016 [Parcubacteria group bacterium GW2011_GWA2_53_21]OGL72515.1 MAG: hypothetical protein A3D69_02065 [Candidatus Uhrbacteria bacterium RIFCSPHIGHO2_02_FULL_54_11]HBL39845.1 hypothetical protein [Candidatus Uhrbacteria bacterium]
MFNKIKTIKDLRSQAKKMQNALAEIIEIGESGGVQIAMDGNQEVQRVEIPEGMLALEHKEKLERAVKDAFNNGLKKIQKQMGAKMKEMGGIDALKKLGL